MDKPDKKEKRPNIFKRFCVWLIKPKSANVTLCWIFTLAALLPVVCGLIGGVNGMTVGAVLGGVLAFLGIMVVSMLSD